MKVYYQGAKRGRSETTGAGKYVLGGERMKHELKTWPEYYRATIGRKKLFEIRKNDREYKTGDILLLKEYNPETKKYTGRHTTVKVIYMLDKQPFVPPGYVCMSIKSIYD